MPCGCRISPMSPPGRVPCTWPSSSTSSPAASSAGGGRGRRTAHADFVLDALEQALHDRRPVKGGLIHHSDRGSQYVAIRYTERLLEAGIEPSVGSVGDSYDRSEERRVGKEC